MTAEAAPERPVAHVNLAAGFRGGERQTELLVRELAGRGWPQRLVARRGGALAARCRGIPGLDLVESASQPLLAAFAARGAALLHAHEARAIYACWLAGSLTRRPWLLTRRVDNPFRRSPLRDRAYRAAARRVGVSSAICRQVAAAYPGAGCQVILDAHGDMAAGHAPPAELVERFRGRTVVGHVGALDHGHKGQGTIIEAARVAAATRPELHFVMVGDGRDEEVLRAAAEGLPNVEFAGFVDDVADWLGVFDVFVFPSLHEGLGSTLLDAMSFGLPIVATNVGGIPDIVDNGVNGLLVEPDNAGALLAAVNRVLDDDVLRAAMREAALERAAVTGPAAMAESYEALYRELIRGQFT